MNFSLAPADLAMIGPIYVATMTQRHQTSHPPRTAQNLNTIIIWQPCLALKKNPSSLPIARRAWGFRLTWLLCLGRLRGSAVGSPPNQVHSRQSSGAPIMWTSYVRVTQNGTTLAGFSESVCLFHLRLTAVRQKFRQTPLIIVSRSREAISHLRWYCQQPALLNKYFGTRTQ